MHNSITEAIADGKKIDALLKLEGRTVAGLRLIRWRWFDPHLRITGSGIFKDQASDAAIRSAFFAGAIRDWQAVVPDFGTVEGPFQITSLEYTGAHDGEATFEIALESAGLVNAAAAASTTAQA